MTFAAIIDPPMLESSPVVKAGEQARPRWVLVARSLLWALNSSGPLTVRLVGSAGERHSSQRGYRKFADQRFPTWDESEGLLVDASRAPLRSGMDWFFVVTLLGVGRAFFLGVAIRPATGATSLMRCVDAAPFLHRR